MNDKKQFLLSNRHLFEQAEAIYRETRGFSRVRISDIQITEWGVDAFVSLIPTPGLLNSRPASWHISSRWDGFALDKDSWGQPYLSLAVYFGNELVNAVVEFCANLPAEEYNIKHFKAISHFLHDYNNGESKDIKPIGR